MCVDCTFFQPKTRFLNSQIGRLLLELNGNGGNYGGPLQGAREEKMSGVMMHMDFDRGRGDMGRARFKLRLLTPMPIPTTTSGVRIVPSKVIKGWG